MIKLEHFAKRTGWFRDMIALPQFIGNSLNLVLATVFINILGLALPLVMLQIYDRIVPNQAYGTLSWLIIGFMIALLLESCLRLARSAITDWIAARFEHSIGLDGVRRMLASRLEDFESSGVGGHIERLAAVSVLRGFYGGQAVQLLLDLPFSVIFLYTIHLLAGWRVAVIPAGVIIIYAIIIGFIKIFYRRSRLASKQLDDRRNNFIVESLSGIHTIKSMTIEEQIVRRYERLQAQTARNTYTINLIGEAPTNLGGMFGLIILFGVILFGGFEVMAGRMTLGALAACTLLGGRVFQPIRTAAGFWVRFSDLQIAKEQLRNLAALRTDSPPDAQPLPEEILGELNLENVAFRYQGGPEGYLIDGVSLNIKPCEFVCIDGPKSSGTTTLLSLMMGHLKPESGQVFIDGFDLADHDVSQLRGRLEYLPQKGVLFKGTVFENITLFNPYRQDNAVDAARLLGLDEALAELPRGYATEVGNKLHEALPSGIIQRISAARALVIRPRILLVDKTDESMDEESERLFIALLTRLKGMCTIVMASNRRRYTGLADRVFRLVNGKLEPVVISSADQPPSADPTAISQTDWMRWVLQTARTWDDVDGVINRIGIPDVDNDHRIFTQYTLELNKLIALYQAGSESIETGDGEKIFDKLINYADKHFRREERILRSLNSPRQAEHIAQHKYFSAMIDRYRAEFDSGRLNITGQFKLAVLDWWVNHINGIDTKSLVVKKSAPIEA